MTALLGLDNVTVVRGDRKVLDKVSMSVSAGERLALIGANGTGKTTLLRTLVGLEKPVGGTVYGFGETRDTEKSFRSLRAKAGLLFQDPDDQLFCATVLDDVAFGPLNLGHSQAAANAIAKETLDRFGLGALASRVTHRLSGGEKRLVSLAAVLAMQPEVLLLDEPTNALDEVHLERLQEILLSLPTAMLIVSHDKYFLERLTTNAMLLRDGHLTHGHVHRHRHFHDDVHVHSDDEPGDELH